MEQIPFIIACLITATASWVQRRKLLQPLPILTLLSPLLFLANPSLAYLIGGILILISAADFLIEGAVWIAEKAGVPPLITGILIIGLGTSMPELFVNLLSAMEGSTGLALGNVLGSNISNMGLVIGAGGLIAGTITIEKSIITKEIPIMLGATLLMILLAWNFFPAQETSRQALSFNDGAVLILGILFYLFYMVQSMNSDTKRESLEKQLNEHYSDEIMLEQKGEASPSIHPIVLVIIGIAGLYFGGDFIITGALDLATALGAGALTLGIIVGVGTSLPELAAAVSAARKGEPDLIIGNVVGSNIFNILLVLGATALISPVYTDSSLLVHFAVVLAMSLLFFFFLGSSRELNRIESALLTLGGLGYLIFSMLG